MAPPAGAKGSPYKGVEQRFSRKANNFTFLARIGYQGTRYCLGTFDNAREAAVEYDLAVLAFSGRGTAKTNFPVEQYSDSDVAALKQRLKPVTPTTKCSKYRGPSLWRGKWDTFIQFQQRKVRLGRFNCEDAAAQQYDLAQLVLADYAVRSCTKLNFPEHWSAMPVQQLRMLAADARLKLQAAQLLPQGGDCIAAAVSVSAQEAEQQPRGANQQHHTLNHEQQHKQQQQQQRQQQQQQQHHLHPHQQHQQSERAEPHVKQEQAEQQERQHSMETKRMHKHVKLSGELQQQSADCQLSSASPSAGNAEPVPKQQTATAAGHSHSFEPPAAAAPGDAASADAAVPAAAAKQLRTADVAVAAAEQQLQHGRQGHQQQQPVEQVGTGNLPPEPAKQYMHTGPNTHLSGPKLKHAAATPGQLVKAAVSAVRKIERKLHQLYLKRRAATQAHQSNQQLRAIQAAISEARQQLVAHKEQLQAAKQVHKAETPSAAPQQLRQQKQQQQQQQQQPRYQQQQEAAPLAAAQLGATTHVDSAQHEGSASGDSSAGAAAAVAATFKDGVCQTPLQQPRRRPIGKEQGHGQQQHDQPKQKRQKHITFKCELHQAPAAGAGNASKHTAAAAAAVDGSLLPLPTANGGDGASEAKQQLVAATAAAAAAEQQLERARAGKRYAEDWGSLQQSSAAKVAVRTATRQLLAAQLEQEDAQQQLKQARKQRKAARRQQASQAAQPTAPATSSIYRSDSIAPAPAAAAAAAQAAPPLACRATPAAATAAHPVLAATVAAAEQVEGQETKKKRKKAQHQQQQQQHAADRDAGELVPQAVKKKHKKSRRAAQQQQDALEQTCPPLLQLEEQEAAVPAAAAAAADEAAQMGQQLLGAAAAAASAPDAASRRMLTSAYELAAALLKAGASRAEVMEVLQPALRSIP